MATSMLSWADIQDIEDQDIEDQKSATKLLKQAWFRKPEPVVRQQAIPVETEVVVHTTRSERTDKTLSCVHCKGTFVFSKNQQASYKRRGYTEPKTCPDCKNQDKLIVCKKCCADILFTKKEQEFFKTKGYPDPKSCKKCRVS
jgi:hypothetical protein